MTINFDPASKLAASRPFLEHLIHWEEELEVRSLDQVLMSGGGPDLAVVVSVDLIKGFAVKGALSSERVGAIIEPVARLLSKAHALGVRHFLFTQDAHPSDSPEFKQYPPHCIAGTEEAEMVDELAALPFSADFVVIPKTSVDSACGTVLDSWFDAHRELTRVIVVGDCTDICIFQAVMHLKVRATVLGLPYEVVVPASCTATYDLPVEAARQIGAPAHDAAFLHRVFLHQMALNGVTVVGSLV